MQEQQNVHVKLTIMTYLQPYLHLFKKFALHRKSLMLAFVSMLVVAIAVASLPILVKFFLESTFLQKDVSHIQITSLAIVMLFIVRGIASYASIHLLNKISSLLGDDLRKKIFDKLLSLPVNYYSQLTKYDIDKLIAQTNQASQNLIKIITTFAQEGLIIIGLMTSILYLNQEFTFLLLFLSPLVIMINQMTQDHTNKSDQKNWPATAKLATHLLQTLRNYREIRVNGGQNLENLRLSKIAEGIYHTERKQSLIKATIIPLGEAATAIILVAAFYFIAQQTLNNAVGVDTVGALITAVLLLIQPIQRITHLPQQMQHELASVQTVLSFLNQASEQDTGTQYIEYVCGKIVFENVRFCAHSLTKPVLDHIDFIIKPGEAIVFTGYIAAEKNALIDLLLRLQHPIRGRILLDDHALTDIALNNLHANIAIITKDSVLLDENVAGNIAYGAMRCANEARITTAAQTSHAAEFIREMPEGLQTKIDEKNVIITKKQCQQISIARALLRKPPILILDEITDDPDSSSLFPILEDLIKNRTTLIFAQHIPQLMKIDRIIRLENGCITNNLKNIQHLAQHPVHNTYSLPQD